MEIFCEFTFEAAHRLPNVPADHKCARPHGHSFRVAIHAEGPGGDESGWARDSAALRAACEPKRGGTSARGLNEVEGLGNPTSERLAEWIWALLAPALPGLSRVVVRETCTSGCVYTGP